MRGEEVFTKTGRERERQRQRERDLKDVGDLAEKAKARQRDRG